MIAQVMGSVALLGLLLASNPVAAASFFVGNCPKMGVPTYPSVEDALAAARNQSGSGPHEIVLCPGSYTIASTQTLDWRLSGLTIRSSSGNRNDVTVLSGSTLFQTETEGITFSGVTLESIKAEPVRIASWSSSVSFDNVVLKGKKGVTIGHAGPVTFTESQIIAKENGIEVIGQVGGLELTKTVIDAQINALWVSSVYDAFRLTDVTLTAADGDAVAVFDGSGLTAQLKNVTIEAKKRGISLEKMSLSLTADAGEKNRVVADKEEAIVLRSNAGAFRVEDSDLSGKAGILIDNRTAYGAWQVRRTQIIATEYGIKVKGGESPLIEDVDIKAGWFALYLEYVQNLQVRASGSTPNRFTTQNNHAIYVAQGNGLIITDSEIDAGKVGIYIANDWSDYTLERNTIQAKEEGVVIENGASNGVIAYNRFERTGGDRYGLKLGKNVLWANATLYGNCFFTKKTAWNNYRNAQFDANGRGNYWGFWSDGCVDANNDGICDTPYSVPGPNSAQKSDRFPLKRCEASPPQLPSLRVAGTAEIGEGDSGEQRVALTVSASVPLTQAVTLMWQWGNGSATAGSACGNGVDFLDTPNALVLPEGTERAQIFVTVCGDETNEADETVVLTGFTAIAADGSVLDVTTDRSDSPDTAVVTIRNDDLPPAVTHCRFDEPVGTWQGRAGEVIDSGTTQLAGKRITFQAPTTTNTVVPQPRIEAQHTITGSFCNAGRFDGNAAVEMPDSAALDFQTEFTASAWIYLEETPKELQSIFSNDINFEFHVNQNRNLYWWWGGGSRALTSQAQIPLRTWTHVAITFNSAKGKGEQRIYINGVPDSASNNWEGTLDPNPCNLYIGADVGTGTNCSMRSDRAFVGMIDEVKVYNTALTPEQIAADMTRGRSCEAPLHHILLVHDGQGLTCSPETVTVRACADSNCTQTYSGTVTVTLAADNGATVSPTPVTVAGGETTVTLRKTTPGATTLRVVSTDPVPSAAWTCAVENALGDCTIDFVDTGLIFTTQQGRTEIAFPTQLSGKPFQQDPDKALNPNDATATVYGLLAVRRDTKSGACVAAVKGAKEVTLKAVGVDPAISDVTDFLERNGSGVINPVRVTFDSTGWGEIGTLTYREAGKIVLEASLPIDVDGSTKTLTGTSNSFVVKPVGFCVAADMAECTVADPRQCGKGKAAGEAPIELTVKAVQWERVNDDDLCTGNSSLTHFRSAPSCDRASGAIALNSEWAGGGSGYQAAGFVNAKGPVIASTDICPEGRLPDGRDSGTFRAAVDNIGVFRFASTLNDYLGAGNVTGKSKPYGRFYAPRIHLAQRAQLISGWGVGNRFLYLGADSAGASNVGVLALGDLQLEAGYARAAYDGANATPGALGTTFQRVTNYHGDYAKIDPAQLTALPIVVDTSPSPWQATGEEPQLEPASDQPQISEQWVEGKLDLNAEVLRLRFTRPAMPVAQVKPLRLRIDAGRFKDAAFNPDHSELVPLPDTPDGNDYQSNLSFLAPDTDDLVAAVDPLGRLEPYTVRFGRLTLGDGSGAAGAITAPLRIEYWRDGAWVANREHSGSGAFDPTSLDFLTELQRNPSAPAFASIALTGGLGEWTFTAIPNDRTQPFTVNVCLPLARAGGCVGNVASATSAYTVPQYLRTCQGSSGVSSDLRPTACNDDHYDDDPRATWSYTPSWGRQERLIDRRERF